MDIQSASDLAPLFQSVQRAMEARRVELNQADPFNGDHGDHMVEIFAIAAQAAEEKPASELGDAMEHAAALLSQAFENGSARVYASGLSQLAGQIRQYGVTLEALLFYVQDVLREKEDESASAEAPTQAPPSAKKGDVLKALVAGLAGWGQVESGKQPSVKPVDMGYLFDLGIAYMQAKQRGSTKLEVIADAAASVSPLASVPHRLQSGRLAIQALLQAMM